MTEEWNEWHGLTEGDMVADLIELDIHHHVPYKEAVEYWDRQSDEYVRKSWWLEIGRHEDGYKGPTSTFVPDGNGGYIYIDSEEEQ